MNTRQKDFETAFTGWAFIIAAIWYGWSGLAVSITFQIGIKHLEG